MIPNRSHRQLKDRRAPRERTPHRPRRCCKSFGGARLGCLAPHALLHERLQPAPAGEERKMSTKTCLAMLCASCLSLACCSSASTTTRDGATIRDTRRDDAATPPSDGHSTIDATDLLQTDLSTSDGFASDASGDTSATDASLSDAIVADANASAITHCGSKQCNAATEICVVDVQQLGPVYNCRAVPSSCTSNRSCACVGSSVCLRPYVLCSNNVAPNVVSCSCPTC